MAFDLLSDRWRQIVVQGGVLEKSPSSEGYLLSGVWILIASDWFEISAVELDGDFRVACKKCSSSPIPETNKLFQPSRIKVDQFPKDCPLDIFMSSGATMVEARILLKDIDGYVFDGSLQLGEKSGKRIEINASTAFPGSLELCQ